jgi:preprotein translocase subunit SecY
VLDPGLAFRLTTMVTLVTGTMFLMWLGEQITERGIGNGISLIIFAGIAAGLPHAIAGTLELQRTGAFSILTVFVIAGLVIGVTALVCFVERGQRRILVNYAKRQVGRKVYGGQSSHLPLKLNMSGVIPPIFASSIILFPATLAGGSAAPRRCAGSPTSLPRCIPGSRCMFFFIPLRLFSSVFSMRRSCSTRKRPPIT